MRILLLMFLFVVGSCTLKAPQQETAGDNVQAPVPKAIPIPGYDTVQRYDHQVYKRVVPASVLALLADKLPGWQFSDPVRYENWQFNTYAKANSLINYLSGDFNCDTIPDYALILEHTGLPLTAWVLQSQKESYVAIKLAEISEAETYVDAAIELHPQGSIARAYHPEEDTPLITLPCDAIELLKLEVSSQLYCWQDGKFVKIQLTD